MKIRLLKETKLSPQNQSNLIREFVKYCIKELGLKSPLPKLILTKDKTKTETYGHFAPGDNTIVVYIDLRNTGDICRTIGHELIHRKQDQDGKLKPNSGETGSSEENEANSLAGVLLRNFGKKYPQIFE